MEVITPEQYVAGHRAEFADAKTASDLCEYFKEVRETVEALDFGSEGEMIYFPKTDLSSVGVKLFGMLGDLYDAGAEYNALFRQEEIEPDENYLEACGMLEDTLCMIDLSLEGRNARR